MSTTVLVTASAGTFPGLAEALRSIPVVVEEVPLMSFAPPLDWAPVDEAVRALGRYAAVAVTSPRAARAFAERVGVLNDGARPTMWAAGRGTAQALGDLLGPVRQPEDVAVGELGAALALATAMLASGVAGRVLFPCGDRRRDELPARLRDGGLAVDEVVCYRSVLAGEFEARRAVRGAQIVVVASPSVADLLARACPPGSRPSLLAVGPTTAAAARASGWPPVGVATGPTTDALAAGVRATLLTLPGGA
jgi:uroporphyrinogen-III synthase